MTIAVDQQVQGLQQYLSQRPRSPQFARLAALYLDQGKAKDALKLCDEGLALYPLYTTAHLVKGKALLALEMKAEARREFELVHELLPNNAYVEELLTQVEGVRVGTVLKPDAGATPATGVEKPPAVKPDVQAQKAVPTASPTISPVTDAEKWLEQQFTSEQETLGTPIAGAAEAATPAAVEEKVEEENPLAALYGPPAAEGPATAEPTEPETQTTPTPTFEAPTAEQATEEAVKEEEPAFQGLETREETPAETAGTSAFPESTEEVPSGLAQDFGMGGAATVEAAPAEEETFGPPSEDPFGFASAQTAEETPSPAVPVPAEASDQGADFGPFAEAPAEAPGSAGETFAEFSERITAELSGTDNTMSLDEYLAGAAASGPAGQPDQIEELAEKLKSAGRITPVINLSEHATAPASEAEAETGTGFVTPTLAEIYAKQGWYDDAIKAYRTLLAGKPAEKEKYEERIKELEEQKKKQGS